MKLWAMYTPDGSLMHWTINLTRKACIADCYQRNRQWPELSKNGYTVRKVKVVEVSK